MPSHQRSPSVPAQKPLPKLCRHATGQAFCRIPVPLAEPDANGRRVRYKAVYFGDWGSTKAIAKYSDFTRAFEANGRREIGVGPRADALLVEVVLRYLEHVREHGSPSTIDGAKQIASLIGSTFRTLRAAEFQPCHIRALQRALIDRGNARSTIQDRMGRIRTMLKWAVSEQLITPAVLELARTVALPSVRDGVRITGRRKPVSNESLQRSLALLTPVVEDMVRIQRYTGCRPGEVCAMSWDQIDKTGAVWLYRPRDHKTALRGHDRIIPLGEPCQSILSKYNHRAPDAPIFSPRESESHRLQRQRERRATPMTPSQRKRELRAAKRANSRPRAPREGFRVDTYNRAIQNALKGTDIPRWTPHQLRHARGHDLAGFSIEEAQSALGHRDPRMAQHYGDRLHSPAMLNKIAASQSDVAKSLQVAI
jgi:integrase